MKALGATSGIGSMMIGAKKAGFEVVGNIEWRKDFHKVDSEGRNTFKENFPGSFMVRKLSELNPIDFPAFHSVLRNNGIDLILGHPDCGNYSQLSHSSGDVSILLKDPGDIPTFVHIIKRLKPRFFVQDNLPKSFLGYSIERWAKELPEYDLFPEYVSNWNYGNIQKSRNRLFIIGALKTEKFCFHAAEERNNETLEDVLYKVPRPPANNEPHSLAGKSSLGKGLVSDTYMTWLELKDYVLNTMEEGKALTYMKSSELKTHIGTYKGRKHAHAFTITSGRSFTFSPWTGAPFNLRERARIQGCPDDFIFYGSKFEPDGGWKFDRNEQMVKQVSKFMPVQFCNYVTQQIADHMNGLPAPEKSVRLLNSSKHINDAKIWYCKNVGYSDQDRVCENCWIHKINCPLK